MSSAGDRPVSPLVVARRFKGRITSGEEKGRISERGIGTLSWKALGFSDFVEVSFSFHESAIRNEFTFRPSSGGRVGGSTEQGTPARELGGNAGELASLLFEGMEAEFEFEEIDAASIGGEFFTDYEFSYSDTISIRDIEESDLDKAMQRVN